MEITTSWERRGHAKGLQEGLEKGLQEGREEGREEGLEEGLEIGRNDGALKIVTKILETRFESLDTTVLKKLKNLPLELLEQLSIDMLNFSTVEEVDAWLHQQKS